MANGLSPAVMIVSANAMREYMTHMQVHSDDPGDDGNAYAHPIARNPISWGPAAANGDFNLATPVSFTGLPADAPVPWVSLWTSLNAGTWCGNFQMIGITTANPSGLYTVTELLLNGTAS